MTWKNELFVFGGKFKKTQVVKVTSCRLELVGQLEFEHRFGDCVNVANNQVILCFNDASGDYNQCRIASSPTDAFSEMEPSQYDHRRTRIATNDGEFIKQGFISTFLLQSLLSLLEATMITTKLNFSMWMETLGQPRTITR